MVRVIQPVRRTTIRDLARVSGVSTRIVTEVLSGRPAGERVRFGEQARQRVLAAVEQCQYRPNRTARNFVRQRHGVVDLVCQTAHLLNASFLHGLLETARKRHGLMVNIEEVGDWRERPPRCLREDATDGVLLLGNPDPALDAALDRLGLPVVNFNGNRREGNGCITFDEEGAMRQVAGAMMAAGRRRLLLLSDGGHYSHAVRERELRRLCRRHGLPPPVVVAMGNPSPEQRQNLCMALSAHADIDAVLVHEDLLGLLNHVCHDQGRRLGDDLVAICIHPGNVAAALCPPPWRLGLPSYNLGCLAVDTLSTLLQGEAVPTLRIPYALSPPEKSPKTMNHRPTWREG